MDYNQYIEQRNTLMNEAEGLINEQKFEDSEAKMQEVKDLDNQFEEIKNKQADLNALKDNEQVVNFENKSENVKGGKVMSELDNTNQMDNQVDYKTAWARYMMNQSLNESEQAVFNQMNNAAYTHDTKNQDILIPETVAQGIFSKAEEQYPFLEDIKKFNVSGNLTMRKHTSIDAGDAGFYTESEEVTQEQNTFGEITLTGKEVAKAITVSWKLQTMAINEFLTYIQNELGKRIGRVLGQSVYTGKGNEKEPHGVLTALEAQSKTPQVIKYDTEIAYKDVTSAMAKIHSTYNDVNIYANNATVWNQLANIVDQTGRPMFIPQPTQSGVGRLFGVQVKADAGLDDDVVVIGSPSEGAVLNTNKGFQLVTEDHARQRSTDYVAFANVDHDVLDEEAFVEIKKKTSGSGSKA